MMLGSQKTKSLSQVLGLLLFTMATSFCAYGQEKEINDIDELIDELFFDDQQFLDELLESNLSYNFLYTSLSYNSNTFFSGRETGVDSYNLIPQVSYYHSSGFNASISGIYYQNFDPNWDFTNLSIGYFNTIGNNKDWFYNVGYSRFFYSDGFDDFTNSIDVNIGVRNRKRSFGTTLATSYIFGDDSSFQLVSSTFVNLDLQRSANVALRFRPSINFIVAQQTVTFDRPIRTPQGPRLFTFSQDVFELLNTQFIFPLSLTVNSWDFELSFVQNLPRALTNEGDLQNTNFFTFSIGYMIDLNK